MPTPDPLTLLRQAIASHQGLGIAAPEVVVGAVCLYEAIPELVDMLRFRRIGHVTIYVRDGKYERVEWHQMKFAS